MANIDIQLQTKTIYSQEENTAMCSHLASNIHPPLPSNPLHRHTYRTHLLSTMPEGKYYYEAERLDVFS